VTRFAGLRNAEVLEATGLDFRTLDHWIRRGAVRPSVKESSGSGNYRLWSVKDVAVLRAIADVRDSCQSLGLQMEAKLVGSLWNALQKADKVTVTCGPIIIASELTEEP
jgi:hypothetical protein